MDIKQLRALITIAETGSVTRAADVLHLVQPAISRQIRMLEEELGVALFERERHGMVLTSAGRKFVERGRRALRELELAKAEIAPAKNVLTGTVVIGFLPASGEMLASRLMGRLRQLYPQLLVRSTFAYVRELEEALDRGEVDVALLYVREAAPNFVTEPILDEGVFLVGPPEADLDVRHPVDITALQGLALVMPGPHHGLRHLVERAAAAAQVEFRITSETNSMSVQKSLVMKDLGLTILPGCSIAEELARGALSAAPLRGLTLTRRIVLARSPAKVPAPALERVIEELRETIQECVAEGGWPGATLVA